MLVSCVTKSCNTIPQISRLSSISNYFNNLVKAKCCFSSTSVSKDLPKQTILYDFHVQNGGKMVDFAGWMMPVQYKSLGIVASHHHTREKCSLFDVSHMLQTKITGKSREKFVESLVVGDVKSLATGCGTLSLFTNENGGILDDLIINKTPEDFLYLVSNAGCRSKIQELLKNAVEVHKQAGEDIELEHIDNGLIALQGPLMQKVLQKGVDIDLSKLYFMHNKSTSVFGIENCRVTRCGYTGEDGVEISVPTNKTAELSERILSDDDVKLAGLGARDSLRLEAGLCLYGNDIDESTTPVEAALTWCIGKRRRAEANFPGAATILDQIKKKPKRKRVGLIVSGSIARAHSPVLDENENVIGSVTSGCPSPTLSANIAMAYLPLRFAKVGTEVYVNIRKKTFKATVTKMPFVPAQYYVAK